MHVCQFSAPSIQIDYIFMEIGHVKIYQQSLYFWQADIRVIITLTEIGNLALDVFKITFELIYFSDIFPFLLERHPLSHLKMSIYLLL